MMSSLIKHGSVIQITDEDHHWFPCLLTVDIVHRWGVTAYVTFPVSNEGNVVEAPIRLKEGQYFFIGEAMIIKPEREE